MIIKVLQAPMLHYFLYVMLFFFNLAYSQEYIRTSQMEKALRLCQETDIYMTNFSTAMAKITDFFEYMDHAGTVFAQSHALNDAIHMWETVRNAYMYGH